MNKIITIQIQFNIAKYMEIYLSITKAFKLCILR
jgi:hypothetical protein